MSVHSNFSRLLLDPNRDLLSDALCRKKCDNLELTINTEENLDLGKRVDLFMVPFQMVVREALQMLKPNRILSVHSFNPEYQGEKRPFEIGLLYHSESKLSASMQNALENNNYNFRNNEPYNAKDLFMASLNGMASWNYPEMTEVVLIEVRNDLCSDVDYREKLSSVIADVLVKI